MSSSSVSHCINEWITSQKLRKQPFTCPTCRLPPPSHYVFHLDSKTVKWTPSRLYFEQDPRSEPDGSQWESQQVDLREVDDEEEIEDPDEAKTGCGAALKGWEEEKRKLVRELRDKGVEMRDLRWQVAELEKYRVEADTLRARVDALEREKVAMKSELEGKENEIMTISEDLVQAQMGQPDLNARVTELEGELEERRNAGQKRMKDLEEIVSGLKDKLRRSGEEIKTLGERHAREIKMEKERTGKLHQEKENQGHSVESAQKQVKEKAKEITALKSSLAGYQDRLAKAKEKNKKLERQLASKQGVRSPSPFASTSHSHSRTHSHSHSPSPSRPSTPEPSVKFRSTSKLPSPPRDFTPDPDNSSQDDNIVILSPDGVHSSPGKKSKPFASLYEDGFGGGGAAKKRTFERSRSDAHLPDFGKGGMFERGEKKRPKIGKRRFE
ncbi:hypothetical protein MNV49_005676 [Pseudohyphozyma bogoriensis]|nr:hypothetical protein MNV49_005676 [Pseudohyphozyma bogoriensis]